MRSTRARRSARRGRRACSASTRTSSSRRARAASSSRTDERGVAARPQHAQPGPRLRGRGLVQPRAARVELPLDRRPGGDRDRAAREARPAARAAGGGGRAVRARCSQGVDVEPLCADDADHKRSWFVYVVALPHGVDRDRVIAKLRARRDRLGGLRAMRPPAAVHARGVRVLGRRRARSPRTSRRGRWRCRSTRSSRPRTRSAWSRHCGTRS